MVGRLLKCPCLLVAETGAHTDEPRLMPVCRHWQMRCGDAGLERIRMDINNGIRRQDAQPRETQLFGNVVGAGQAIAGRHADMGHDVDRAAQVADSQVIDVVEAVHSLRRVLQFVMKPGVTVIEQPQEYFPPGLNRRPRDQQPDPHANRSVEPRRIEHDSDRCGNDTERRKTVRPRMLPVCHQCCAPNAFARS